MNWSKGKHFVLSANFHGGAVVANYPWDGFLCWKIELTPLGSESGDDVYNKCPDDDIFKQLALSYSTNHAFMSQSTEFANGITNGAGNSEFFIESS